MSEPISSGNQGATIKNPMLYFVPPITGTYMEWGQTFIIFLFVAAMFLSIAFIYIYIKIDEYQNRINVIANATVFGQNPQEKFKNFIQSTQAEALAAVMNNIQTTSHDINSNTYRLDDRSQRLSKQVATNVTDDTGAKIASLGESVSRTIGGILNNIQTGLAQFTLNNSMQNGAVKTTQKL